MWRSLRVACSALLCGLPATQGHGYLAVPPSRNLIDSAGDTRNCGPHCGNGGSEDAPGSICGDGHQWPSQDYYVKAEQEPHRTYEAGSIVQFEVSMNVNHKGHHEFFICDRAINSDVGAVECFQKWPLMRVPPEEVYDDCVANDPREDCQPIDPHFPGRWYHPEGMPVHRIRYRIPTDLSCTHCTLLWFWPTGNSVAYDIESYSCQDKMLKSLGWDVNFCRRCAMDQLHWTDCCSDNKCPENYAPTTSGPRSPDPAAGTAVEEFRNCADIRVVAPSPDGTSGPTTGWAPSPSASTPAPATPPMVPAQEVCAPIADCGAMGWCDMQGYVDFCAPHATWDCPAPFCHVEILGMPSAGPIPAPAATPAPSSPTPATEAAPIVPSPPMPAPEATPVPSPPVVAGCMAAPGMWESNGVTDADCAACAEGRTWWPCDSPEYCQGSGCSGAALPQVGTPALRRGRPSAAEVRRHGLAAPALIQREVKLSGLASLPMGEL